jgi:hypothetical protein
MEHYVHMEDVNQDQQLGFVELLEPSVDPIFAS